MTGPIEVREATTADSAAVAKLHDHAWGGPIVVGHGVTYDLTTLPTLVGVGDAVEGVLTYQLDGDSLEVVSIVASQPGRGVGSALLTAAKRRTPARLWLITTNDNLDALRFYQRNGLRIVGVAVGAVDRARERKPTIPLVGAYGIALHDERTLEWIRP